ncbi:MAG: hypothetical protein EXR73_06005 [Myxococcales bacterium]|nr:hypothetical protein [Myxococcales bacterium]
MLLLALLRLRSRALTFTLATTLAALPGAACGDDAKPIDQPDASPPAIDAGPDASTLSPQCTEALDSANWNYTWIQLRVLTPSCASFTACHMGTNPAGQLNLTIGLSHAELVNVASIQRPDALLVAPSDPDASYLLVKLGLLGTPEPIMGMPGTTMPPQSELLCAPKLEAVRQWILAGALPE